MTVTLETWIDRTVLILALRISRLRSSNIETAHRNLDTLDLVISVDVLLAEGLRLYRFC